MAAGCNCKAAIGCVDARVPMRASYVSLYKWPESDAEFVRSVAMARRHGIQDQSPAPGSGSMRHSGELLPSSSSAAAMAGYNSYSCSPRVVDSYSCRQMYLRSYTFSKKKETVPERTMACLGRVVRDRTVFPLFGGGGGGGSSASASDAGDGSVGSSSNRVSDDVLGGLRGSSGNDRQQGRKQQEQEQSRWQKRRRRRKKKKGSCAVVRRLHEASCAAVRAVFRRLLACTTSVDVAEGAGGAPPP